MNKKNLLGIVLTTAFAVTVNADVAFPSWLKELSGLSDWPDSYAPYVPMPDMDLHRTRSVAQHEQWECSAVRATDCSFDCDHCTLPSDVQTCTPLSQTFDDGPTEATVELLDGLRKTKTKSTFFLIGLNVVEWPEIVRRQHQEKHLIAVHTWSHKYLPALTDKEVVAELQWCIWAINATIGVVPRYFRPPYGGIDNRIRDLAAKLDLVVVLWDRDTDDWQLNQGTRTASEVLADVSHWTADSSAHKGPWSFFKSTKTKGLLLEHDLSQENVKLALKIKKNIKGKQKTVAQCAKQKPYL